MSATLFGWLDLYALAGLALVVALFVFLGRDPASRRLLLKNTLRRPRRAAYYIVAVVVWGAMVTVPVVAGSSLHASILDSATTQLGPVDEVVVAAARGPGSSAASLDKTVVSAHIPHVDGALPLLALSATMTTNAFVVRVSTVQIIEVDFPAADRFGGDAASAGLPGPTPPVGEADLGADLAHAVGVNTGIGLAPTRVILHVGSATDQLNVARVLPKRGLAGLPVLTGAPEGQALDVFVPPGTIESLAAQSPGITPLSVVAVSNTGGVAGGLAYSNEVTQRLHAALGDRAVGVRALKEQVVHDASESGHQFTEAFAAFAAVGGTVGLLLMFLSLSLLSEDRAPEDATIRILGASRSRLAAMVAAEGWLWALLGSIVGVAVGWVAAHLLISAARTTIAADQGVQLRFSGSAAAFERSLALGLAGAAIVVALVALGSSRRNLVAALRGLPATPVRLVARWLRPALILAGAVLGGTVIAVVSTDAAFGHPGPAGVAAAGLLLTLALLLLATIGEPRLGTLLGKGGSGWRPLPARLGGAYLSARPLRTGITVGMYAIVAFGVIFATGMSSSEGAASAAIAHRIGGGSQVAVVSNPSDPVPVGDVVRLPGVTRVASSTMAPAELGDGEPVTAVGFDNSLLGSGPPALEAREPQFPSAAATYKAVSTDPNLILVGADLNRNLDSGFASAPLEPGQSLELRNPATGAQRSMRVAGVLTNAAWGGDDHVFMSEQVLHSMFGAAWENLLWVSTAPGTNNDVLAAVINGTHVSNSATAASFRALAAQDASSQQTFVDLAGWYVGFALLAAVAGLAAVTARSVDERRADIAILRTYGGRKALIRRTFTIEALSIALVGGVIGTVAAAVYVWRLAAAGALGKGVGFSPSWRNTGLILAVLLIVTAIAVVPSIRRAGAMSPAQSFAEE